MQLFIEVPSLSQLYEEPRRLRRVEKVCLITFFFLGNYFAAAGFWYARKGSLAKTSGDSVLANRMDRIAYAWSYLGLIPSTIINVALLYSIYLLCRFTWEHLSNLYAF